MDIQNVDRVPVFTTKDGYEHEDTFIHSLQPADPI